MNVGISITNPEGYENPSNDYGVAGAAIKVSCDLPGEKADTVGFEIDITDVGAVSNNATTILQKAQTYTVNVKAVSTEHETVLASFSKTITIYEGVSHSYIGDWDDNVVSKAVWDDEECQLGLKVNRKDSKCKVEFEINERVIEEDKDGICMWKSKSPLSDRLDYNENVKCTIRYSAPDGRILKKMDKTFSYNIFHKPTNGDFLLQSKVGDKVDEIEDYKNIYLYHNSPVEGQVNLSIKRSGLFSGVRLSSEWKKNDVNQTVSNENLKHIPYTGEDKNHTDKYDIILSYFPDERLSSPFYADFSVNVITYQEPSISSFFVLNGSEGVMSDSEKFVIWDDTEIGFSSRTSGGNVDGWTYQWKVGSAIVEDCLVEKQRFGVVSGNSQTYVISIHVENRDPDDGLLFEAENAFEVVSWKKPDLSMKDICRYVNEKSDYNDTIYLYENYNSIEYGERYFSIPDLGYDSNYWTYCWIDGDIEESGTRYTPSALSVGVREIVVSARYAPKGLLRLLDDFYWEKTVQVKTFEQPSCHVEQWEASSKLSVWEDTKISLLAESYGGNTSSWFFFWDNNQDSSEEFEITIDVDEASSIFRDYLIGLKVENKDPDNLVWYKGESEAIYRSYCKPLLTDIPTIRIYQNADTIVHLNDYIGGNYSDGFWTNSLEIISEDVTDLSKLVDDGRAFRPELRAPELGFHETWTVEYRLNVSFRPDDNMSEDISFTDNVSFCTEYWPAPGFKVRLTDDVIENDRNVPVIMSDGSLFQVDVEVSDCIDEDSEAWEFLWTVDDKVSEWNDKSSYESVFFNNGSQYRIIPVIVKVRNRLSHGNEQYESSISFNLRIKPQFNTKDNMIEILPSEEIDGRYNYVPYSYFDGNSYVYSTMDKFNCLRFPIEYSEEKYISSPNDWRIFEKTEDREIMLSNTSDGTGFHFNGKNDTIIIDAVPEVESFLSNTDSEYVSVSYRIEYQLSDTIPGVFEPEFRINIYRKPEITTTDDWDNSIHYIVWDDSEILTEAKIQTESTKNWEYKWYRVSDGNSSTVFDEGSISTDKPLVLKESTRADEVLRLVATCYAPNNSTVWYQDTLERHFAIWKRPSRKVLHFQTDTAGNCLQEKSAGDTLNVCVLYSDEQQVSISFQNPKNVPDLEWNDTVMWGEQLNVCYEEKERNQNDYLYATYRFDSFSDKSEPISDSICFVNRVIPIRPDGYLSKYLIDTLKFSGRLYVKIWPKQQYRLDNENEFSLNDSKIIVQVGSGSHEVRNPLSDTHFSIVGELDNDSLEYEWRNEKDQEWRKSKDLAPLVNITKTYMDSTYNVRFVVKGYDGLNWCEDSVGKYTVRCYPSIVVPVMESESFKDSIDSDILHFIREYDYVFPGEWKYENSLSWTHDGKELLDDEKKKSKSFDFYIKGNGKLKLASTVSCMVENGFNLEITDKNYQSEINVHPYDEISVPDAFQLKGGTPNTIIHKGLEKETEIYPKHDGTSYGQNDWTYIWKIGNDTKEEEKIDAENHEAIGKNSSYIDVEYSLDATYKPGNARPRQQNNLKFHIREYTEPVVPSGLPPVDNQFRECDPFIYKFDDKSFLKSGNPDCWVLVWILDNTSEKSSVEYDSLFIEYDSFNEYVAVLPEISDEKPSSKQYIYTVKLKNFHPDKTTAWKDIIIGSSSLTLYNRPPEPKDLVIKGKDESSNTSGIYIALFGPDVIVPDYTDYVFGTADGVSTTINPFFRYQGEKTNEIWVRTKWHYDDFDCYSDTVFHKPATDAVFSKGELNVDYMHFSATVEKPETAVVRIIDSTGRVVQTISYDARTDFDEDIELTGLTTGMYLIRVEVGNLVETKTTLIRWNE